MLSLISFSEKCELPTYDVRLQSFGLGNIGITLSVEDLKDEHHVYIFYDSTNVIYYQQIPILSFWGFLSSAGGSLGLFLGFSCYSSLSAIVEYINNLQWRFGTTS